MTITDLNNYLANVQCCLSQKGANLFNKARGGQLDKCCMTEHAFQRAVWDVLRHSNIGSSTSVSNYSEAGTKLLVTQVCWSEDGGADSELCYTSSSSASPSAPIYIEWVGAVFTVGETSETAVTSVKDDGETVVHSYTSEPLQYTPPIVSFGNAAFTIEYDTSNPDYILLTFTKTSTGEYVILKFVVVPTETFEFSCLTEEQMCDMVNFLNSYCGGCSTYTPESL